MQDCVREALSHYVADIRKKQNLMVVKEKKFTFILE